MLFLLENWSSEKRLQVIEEWKKKNPHKKPGGNPPSDTSRPSILWERGSYFTGVLRRT